MKPTEHAFSIGSLDITYLFHPEDKGRLSGPWEDCYPPEAAFVEVLSVTVGIPALDIIESLRALVGIDTLDDRLEERCMQHHETLN